MPMFEGDFMSPLLHIMRDFAASKLGLKPAYKASENTFWCSPKRQHGMATVWVPELIAPCTHYPIIIAWPVVPAPPTTWALGAHMLCAGECLGMLEPHSTMPCTTLQSVCREARLSRRRCLRSAWPAALPTSCSPALRAQPRGLHHLKLVRLLRLED